MGYGDITRLAEAAMSPQFAWEYYRPMKKTWMSPLTHNPDSLCSFYSRHPSVKALIWC